MPKRGSELKILFYVTRTNMPKGEGATVMKEVGYSEVLTFGRMNIQELIQS